MLSNKIIYKLKLLFVLMSIYGMCRFHPLPDDWLHTCHQSMEEIELATCHLLVVFRPDCRLAQLTFLLMTSICAIFAIHIPALRY